MKQTFYLLFLSLILIATSCSDTSDVNELTENEANLEIDISDDIEMIRGGNPNQRRLVLNCDFALNPIEPVTPYVIEYEPGLTDLEKQDIRESQPSGYIYCIDNDHCPDNDDIELWWVRDCPHYPSHCRPKNQEPEDPDIKRRSNNTRDCMITPLID